MVDPARGPKECRPRRRQDFHASEADRGEHSTNRCVIWSPPISRISIQFLPWIESGRRPPDPHHVNDRLQNQAPTAYGCNSFEGQQRIRKVVEHSKKKHEVESPHRLRRKVKNINVNILDARSQDATRQLKPSLSFPCAPALPVPRVIVGSDNSLGVSSLCFK